MTFIRLDGVRELTGLSRSRVYDLVSQGQFPPPVKIGVRAVAWSLDEIEAWMRARLAERGPWDGAPAAVEARSDRLIRGSDLSRRA